MAEYVVSDTSLTAVADAIRTKGGTSASLAFPAGFVSAVEAIETGGGGVLLADYTATEAVSEIIISDVFDGYPVYVMTVEGDTSTTEWIYIKFNGTTDNKGYYGGSAGARTWNFPIYFYQVPSGGVYSGTNAGAFFFSTMQSNTANIAWADSSLTQVRLHLYASSARFNAGFKVQVWGYSL